MENSAERLERAIAHQGLASRREAKELIRSGFVRVNGEVILEPGYGIDMDTDKIEIDQEKLAPKESILLYKPRGLETNATTPGGRDVHTEFPHYAHLAPIGRLDKDSEGLLILSNDGTLTSALTRIGSHVGKTYLVTTREAVSDASLDKMRTGIMLDDTMTKPADIKRDTRISFEITLHEGRKHQIRRMCDSCRLTITSLIRIRIGEIHIGTLIAGKHRPLTPDEIAMLKK